MVSLRHKTLLATITLLFALSVTPSAYAADDQGWTIYQVKPKPSAPNIIYISKEGVRFTDGSDGITLVARAPDWTLTYFNDKEKTYATETMQAWRQRYWVWRDGQVKQQEQDRTQSTFPYVKGSTKSIDGMKATQYFQRCANGGLTVYVADLPVAAQLNELVGMLSHIPANRLKSDGVMLEKYGVDTAGQMTLAMLNSRCKKTKIPAATFDPPRGYRKVSLVDVYGEGAVDRALPFTR